jgi:steroid delta-isomerase-like uncharacterized protein
MDTRELISRYYAAFNAADWEGMLALLTPDVAHDINQGGRETGVDAFRAFLARMNRCYAEQLADIVIMAEGDRAAAEFVVHGRYIATDEGLPAATGETYTLPAGAFFGIRAGRIARVTNFYNTADWLKQVGA